MLYSGRLIWNIREELGLNRRVLAEGLCSISQIIRIENNKRDADKLLFESLYQRLGKYSGRFEMLLDADEYIATQKRWEIADCIDDCNYDEAFYKIAEYKKADINNIEKQYMCLLECEIMHKTGKPYLLCMDKLKEAINYTRKNIDLAIFKDEYYSRLEMLIIQQYYRYHELIGNKECAVDNYLAVLDTLKKDRYDRTEKDFLYRHTAYWLMSYYMDNMMYEEAYRVGMELYECIISSEKLTFLAEVIDNLNECCSHIGTEFFFKQELSAILNRYISKYGATRATEFFPRYIEENAYNVNEIISQRRKMLHISQESLSSTICDVTTISLMENHNRTLQKIKRDNLLKLVMLSGDKYVANIDTYNYKVFKELNDIRDIINRGEFANIEKILEGIKQKYELCTVNSRQYLFNTYCDCNILQGNYNDELIEQIKVVLAESLGNIDDNSMENVILLYNEWSLIQKIILYYKSQSLYDDCMKYMLPIYKTYKELRIDKNPFINMYIRCQLGDILGEMKQVDKANQELKDVLYLSARRDSMTYIRYAAYVIAWNLLEEKEDISESEREMSVSMLEIAYVFAKIYKNEASINRINELCEKHRLKLTI